MADETLDDSILEQYRALTSEVESPAEEAPEVEQEEQKETKSERARDESGRFAKSAQASEEPASPAVEEAPASEDEPEPLTLTNGQPIDLNRAPSSWKPAAKVAWANLPPEVRQEVYRRESDFLKGNSGLKETADFGQSMKSAIEPFRMLIEAEGGSPERAVTDLFRTAAALRTGTQQQKLQTLFAIDQKFGTGLQQYFNERLSQEVARATGQQPQQQYQQQFQDPRVDTLMQQLQAQQQERERQENAAITSAIDRFSSAKDEKGAPKYPFFDNVIDDMADRVAVLRRANPSMSADEVMTKAYDAACWANPEVRDVLMAQRQASQNANVETLRKAQEAKRAAAANLPKRGSLPPGSGTGTMDDTIRETFHKLTAAL